MLRNRIIPFLLIDNKGNCIKTTNFKDRNYIGDILNNIRIFNEKKVDEIAILDIDSSKEKNPIKFDLISKIASVCRMPLTYGGGISDLDSAKKIISLGVEKICLNTSAIDNFDLLKKIYNEFGSQSLSVSINYKKIKNNYIFVDNNQIPIKEKCNEYIRMIQENGVGEIIFNSIDRDGTMMGYDLGIINLLKDFIKVPSVIVGGCSNYDDIKELFKLYPNTASGCSSIFIYKGKLKAVLINYPSEDKKNELMHNKNNNL